MRREFNGLDKITEMKYGDYCNFTSKAGTEYTARFDINGKLKLSKPYSVTELKPTKEAKRCFMLVDKYSGIDECDKVDEIEELFKAMHKHRKNE